MLILSLLCIPITAYISWETDRSCKELLKQQWPSIHQRDDFSKDDIQSVMDLIDQIDPSGEAEIIFTAGPPCPDFSTIRGKNAPGRSGNTGQLFDKSIDFLKALREMSGRKVRFMFENVVMKDDEQKNFNRRLECTAVVGDSADLGLIRRPRLWWIQVDWAGTGLRMAKRNLLPKVTIPKAVADICPYQCNAAKIPTPTGWTLDPRINARTQLVLSPRIGGEL